jgi:hypothetical protein
MEDKFQQVYDYLKSNNLLAEGSTMESFANKYADGGEGNARKLYGNLSAYDDLPFELGDFDQFQSEVFGPVKKKSEPDVQSPQEFPSVEGSTESTLPTPQATQPPSGGLEWRLESKRIGSSYYIGLKPEFVDEPNYLKGSWGDFVNSIPFFGDTYDDTKRAVASGSAITDTYDPTRWVFADPTPESSQAYYDAMIKYEEDLKRFGKSEEMKKFESRLEADVAEYGSWFALFKGMAENPSAGFEFLLSSFAGMGEDTVIRKGVEVVSAAAAGGVGIGLSGGPAAPISVTAGVTGAVGISGPFALAAMGGEVELMTSLTEFLKEEIDNKGMEFSPESVLAVLSDDDLAKSIRNRALARKNTIMTVDAVLGSFMARTFRAARVANKVSDMAVVGGELMGDVAIGSGGEALARVAADQEPDPVVVAQSGLTGLMTQGPVNLTSTYLGIQNDKIRSQQRRAINDAMSNKRYIINGELVSEEAFSDVIETSSPEELMEINLEVQNDEKTSGRLSYLLDRAQVEVKMDESIQGETREKLIELEVRLKRLDGEEGRHAERARESTKAAIDGLIDQHYSQTPSVPVMSRETRSGFTDYLKNVLKNKSGQFAHMTAENPGVVTLSPEENASRNAQLKEDLIKMGYEPVEIDGKYDNDEKSFFVEGMTQDDAIKLGKKYGQESVAHSEGMLYTTGDKKGKKNPATGEVTVDDTLDNYYSVMKTDEGEIKYNVGYDWDTLEPIQTTKKTKGDVVDAAEEAAIVEADKEAVSDVKKAAEDIKAEDIYTGAKRNIKQSVADVLTGRTKFQRRYFSARKFLPRSAFKAFEQRTASMSTAHNRLKNVIADFEKIEKAIPENQREKFYNDFDAYMRGGEPGTLSREAAVLALEMRSEIDNLSMQLVNLGLVPGASVDKVIGNLGQYMNVAYRNFEGADWKKQLETQEGQAIKERARKWLREEDTEIQNRVTFEYGDASKRAAAANALGVDAEYLTEKQYLDYVVEGEINKYLENEEMVYSTSGQLGTKDAGILKQRKDLPKQLQDLLGMYTDPLQNYAKTVFKMVSMAEQKRFTNGLIESGKDKYLFTDPSGIYDTQVNVGGEKFFTTSEIAKQFAGDYDKPWFQGRGIDMAMTLSGGVKWAKTIASVGTHSKNVLGNVGFLMANGHLNPWNLQETGSNLLTAADVVYNDLKSLNKGQLREKMQYYIDLGIVKQNTDVNEVRSLFQEDQFENAAASRLEGSGKKSVKKGKEFLENLYQSEDDLFKIIAFENEKSRYSQAMFGVESSKLTDQQRAEVDGIVSEVVKNTFPTYSRTPAVVDFLKRNPFVGNFVSFQAESFRTQWNIVSLALQEVQSDNPAVKAIGASRLTGFAAYNGLKTSLIGSSAIAVGMGAQGAWGAITGSETEKERERDIRKFTNFWSRNSKLYMTDLNFEEGKFSYIDFSASDPFGGTDRIIEAITNGESVQDAFKNTMIQFVEPFVGKDIAYRRFENLTKGVDDYGRRLWYEDDPDDVKIGKMFTYMVGMFEPGTMTSVRKVMRSDAPLEELAGQFTGYRETDIDIRTTLGFMLREHREAMEQDSKIRYEDFDRDKDMFFDVDSYNKANDYLQKREALVYEDVMSALRLGVTPEDIEQMIIDNLRCSKERANSILLGPEYYEPLPFDPRN